MQGSYEILKCSELLNTMPETILERLFSTSNTFKWKAGEIIRPEQTEDDEIFLLIGGQVRSDVLLCNTDQMLGYAIDSAGSLIGLFHFIEAGKYPFTLTAETDVEIIAWHASDFREAIETDPDAAYRTAVYTARELYRKAVTLNTYLLDNVCWGLP